MLHSDDKPAIYDKDAELSIWYNNGVILNGNYKYKNKEYHFSNGLLNSLNDQPAEIEIEYDGTISKYWYKEGRLHRTVGPASIDKYGQDWFIDGLFKRYMDGYIAADDLPVGTIVDVRKDIIIHSDVFDDLLKDMKVSYQKYYSITILHDLPSESGYKVYIDSLLTDILKTNDGLFCFKNGLFIMGKLHPDIKYGMCCGTGVSHTSAK